MKRLISFILLLAFAFNFIYADASKWADTSMKEALYYNLATEELLKSDLLQKPITRKEFAALSVILYARKKNIKISDLNEYNPFDDSDSKMVAKAYNLNIVKGTGVDKKGRTLFSPNSLVTRQEMAVMITNVLKALDYDTKAEGKLSFKDASSVAKWAYNELLFANKNAIINGFSKDILSPKSNATREQAIAIMVRVFKKYDFIRKESSNALIRFKDKDKYLITFREIEINEQIEELKYLLLSNEKINFNEYTTLYHLLDASYDDISKEFKNKKVCISEKGKVSKRGNILFHVDGSIYLEIRR